MEENIKCYFQQKMIRRPKKWLNKMRYCQKSNLWIGVGNPLNSAKYTGQINELPGYYDL